MTASSTMTRLALVIALALALGVAVRPSTPGAVAVGALALVAAVFRRQDSQDVHTQATVLDRMRMATLEQAVQDAEDAREELANDLKALREEFDKVKLQVPRPK